MKSRWPALATLSLLLLPGVGCGTLIDLAASSPHHESARIYGGVRTDLEWIEGPNHPHAEGLANLLGILDFPFSLGLDTGLLPVTLVVALFRELLPEPNPNPSAPPADPR